ncbi:MAG: RluA family pseudouridine synthase [Bifidobacteriaceae bacterium]|jgi:23S rRNA pseudouridine1911/1915/1917 synthase|nr:RluA family pseudouridine synthase [Bifidobacteriaceae bacterium]
MEIVRIKKSQVNKRVDIGLAETLGLSRSKIQNLINDNRLFLKGKSKITKSYILKLGDKFEYYNCLQKPTRPVVDISVLYNDEQIIVVDKPTGVATHPAESWMGADVFTSLVINGFLPTCKDSPFTTQTKGEDTLEPSGIVSRLDAGTSGVLLISKTPESYSKMMESFKFHKDIEKHYIGAVEKHLKHSYGIIDAPIGRSSQKKFHFTINADGKYAVTHYKVIKSWQNCQLLDIRIETGRTHQIRVHFSHLGHPVLGDITYGANSNLAEKYRLTRPFLHSSVLKIIHPITCEKMEFRAPLPKELNLSLGLINQDNFKD